MKVLLAVVAALSLVDLGTPCCLPDQVSFDFSVAINMSRYVNGKHYTESREENGLSGKGALDFKAQKFYLGLDDFHQHILIDLSKQPGSMKIAMQIPVGTNKTATVCHSVKIFGTVGTEWQCLLDNAKYFTKLNKGKSYRFTIPKIIDGPVTMIKDQCIPVSGDMTVKSPPGPPGVEISMYVTIDITNAVAKIADKKILELPCPEGVAIVEQPQTIDILTPDQVVGLLERAYAYNGPEPDNNTPEPESASESSDDDESSDEDESESEANEENTEEEGEDSSQEDSSSEDDDDTRRRKRQCVIPGAVCY